MTYLLDTNVCIALINGRPEAVRSRFEVVSSAGQLIAMSSLVTFELWYGAAKSRRQEANVQRLSAFLAGPIEVLDFEDEDARVAGQLRSTLEIAGTPIGAYDVLIAGQALRHGATLVTANTSEFARVSGLSWEDWVTD